MSVAALRRPDGARGLRSADPFASLFGDLFGPRARSPERSEGSGVLIDASGIVLTNFHVVRACESVEVELTDGRRVPAEVAHGSMPHDLAVLQVKRGAPLPHLPMGTSRDLLIGETVIAIGNPFGLGHTVTTGVISALHRMLRTDGRDYTDLVQTDAVIHPGNSGGPLLTVDGALVGINTAIFEGKSGIGFAIPIDRASRIVAEMLRFGEVRRPNYGFEPQDLTAELRKSLGLDDGPGALIAEVDVHGPSDGILAEGDVIVAVEGAPVTSSTMLRLLLLDYSVGVPVAVERVRAGHKTTVSLSPQSWPAQAGLERLARNVGLEVAATGQPDAPSQLPAGLLQVARVQPRSQAAQAGLLPGDLLRAVNAEKVVGIAAFNRALMRQIWAGQIQLLVQRGHLLQEMAFPF